jgi:hypothetical protein
MAEVIRRGFEAAHQVEWPEEDRAFGIGYPGLRTRLFGSERPFDKPFLAKPFVAYHFGLFTGSAVSWYVEGDTEYYALLRLLGDPSTMAIELVNLRGEIGSEKKNAALKLEDALKNDLALRRFSVVSFDCDVKANERAIVRLAECGKVIGGINANRPDFEFANFTLDELAEIAALMDDRLGFDGSFVRNADWQGTTTSRMFAERYAKVSERRRSNKGREWGEELAIYAAKNPLNPRTGQRRPFIEAADAARWAWRSNYDYQKDHFQFDPKTFTFKPK